MKYDQSAAGSRRLGAGSQWATSLLMVALLGILSLLIACRGPDLASYPGPPEGVRMIAEVDDYGAVFNDESLRDAKRHYEGFWAKPSWVVGPAPGQTEFRVEMATSEQLAAGTGAAPRFPGGYRAIAPHLKPGLTVYEIIFVAPGQTYGVILDGLVYVNGKWRIFPAPWRVLTVNEPGHQH
jgi:hypothetical protein